MRRCWVVWKADHNDLAATKRLISRMMKASKRGNKAIMSNILTSAQGMSAMGDLRARFDNCEQRGESTVAASGREEGEAAAAQNVEEAATGG